jgi:hypothetical protein
MALYDDAPLILDSGVVRQSNEQDTVPASVLWGRCKNVSGGTLPKGTPVYVVGNTTAGFTPEVAAADAGDPAKMPAIGVLDVELDDEEEGPILYVGFIQNVPVDPGTFSAGDQVYVAVGGGYTPTKPSGTGDIVQYLGVVTRADLTNGGGQIFCSGRADEYPDAGIPVSLGNAWDATSLTPPTGTIVGTTDTQTLTNKSIEPRVSSTASVTSPLAWDSDDYDLYAITAQAEALTINADAGTPVNGQKIIFRIKDDGTARALTWTTGSSGSFREIGITLPTTTTINKTTYVGCIYNSADSRWDAIATVTEA